MSFSDLIREIDWGTALPMISAAGIGYLGIRATNRSQKDVALGPDWEKFTTQIRQWADTKIAEAEAEVDEERGRRRILQHKYRAALRGLRSILSRHPSEREHLDQDVQEDL